MRKPHKTPETQSEKQKLEIRADAAHHLQILDPRASEFTFQTFPDRKDLDPQRVRELIGILHGSLEQHFEMLLQRNRLGAGVFVTVNQTDLKGRQKHNIERIRALWQEADREDVPELPLEPHLIIQSSPGKFHRYVLVDGMPLGEFEPTQQRLVADFGSDPNAKDSARVLRLAGFYHVKGEPYQVRIIHESGAPPYPWPTVRKAFPAVRRQAKDACATDFDQKDWPRIKDALEYIDPTAVVYDDWLRVGMALHSTGHPDAYATWDEWSCRDAARYAGPDDLANRWGGFDVGKDKRVGPGTIFHLAQPEKAAAALADPKDNAGDADTDDGLALEFVRQHEGKLRWVERWGRWFKWDGMVWREDGTLRVFDLTRSFLRSHDVKKPNRLLDARRIAAVERLARSDRAVATTPDELDSHDWLLNTRAGVVNLNTGELQPHEPGLLLTKITACGIGGKCPRWERFLLEVTGDDPELAGFLQRLAGYCLTGSTREHALFFLYGTGGNGKGVFLNTLRAIMADLAEVSSTDVFTASKTDRHPTELAALRGARLVVAQEVEEGRRWAEAKIKALTGGDPVSARFMRQDFFEYVPNFKLIIAGNHKPRLSTVDEAIRRRLYLVPFEVSIPEGRRDLDLAEKLAPEHPAILAWAVRGCLLYLEHGLQAPQRVKAATEAYFASQDLISEFLAERCETGPGYWEKPATMFQAWRDFAIAQGLQPGRQAEFRDRLERAGLRQERSNKLGRHWQGVRVKESDVAATPRDRTSSLVGRTLSINELSPAAADADESDLLQLGPTVPSDERDILWLPDPQRDPHQRGAKR